MTEGNSDTADSSGMAIDPLSANWGYYRVGAATRRLVAVSNRVTSTGGAKPDSGGLAVAIRSALQESGGVWFGWSGEVVEEPTDEPGIAVDGPSLSQLSTSRVGITMNTISVTPIAFSGHYSITAASLSSSRGAISPATCASIKCLHENWRQCCGHRISYGSMTTI
jgi:hypothetical protein